MRVLGKGIVLLSLIATSAGAQVTERWVARYSLLERSGTAATSIAFDSTSGNAYVTGTVYTDLGPAYGTVAYDSSGNELWEEIYNGPENSDYAIAIAVDGTLGNVYVTGKSSNNGTEYATVAYDSSGSPLWEAHYRFGDFRSFNTPAAIAVDATSGNVYVTGYSQGSGVGSEFATVAYDSSGNQLWVARYHRSVGTYAGSAPSAIAVDRITGRIYVTGSATNGQISPTNYATVAYDRNGNQLWVAFYEGGYGDDQANAIAMDSTAGRVYVTGKSKGVGGIYSYATVAYNASGNQLWMARYNAANSNAFAKAIAVHSPTGRVFVTGQSYGGASGDDYATLAYSPGGNQLWVARYNGPGNGHDSANAMATDTAGNVYVTGQSDGGGGIYGYATVAYNVNGNLLWVARYDGQGNGYDYPYAIAVDSATRNVYVTGASGTDYATIQYSQP